MIVRLQVVRINTHGATPTEIEADKAIITNKRDDHKRRTVKLERIKPTTSWGFTLQVSLSDWVSLNKYSIRLSMKSHVIVKW